MLLTGKSALVVGGSRGTGRAISLAIGREGADVIVNYATNAESAAETVRELEAMGRRAIAVKADAGNSADMKRLVEEANTAFGRVDLLVTNAGSGNMELIPETTDETWHRMIDVNVTSALALCRELLPQMHDRRFGRIVTISSLTAKTLKGYWSTSPLGAKSAYGAAKAALLALTMGIALEGAPYVTANCVCPGLIDKGQFKTPEQLAVKERAVRDAPLARLTTPEDVADAVVFFLSDRARFITGQSLNVAGGLLMQ